MMAFCHHWWYFVFRCTLSLKWLAVIIVKSWRFVAFRDKQCSRPTCHRAARHSSGLLRVSWLALMESLGLTGRHGPQARLALASLASIAG